MQRSEQQNKAIHLYCTMLADALNNAGYDMKQTLKQDAEIPWNGDRAKEFLWRPLQRAMLEKESTTELSRSEVSQVYEVLDRHISSKFGVHIEFPSEDNINVKRD